MPSQGATLFRLDVVDWSMQLWLLLLSLSFIESLSQHLVSKSKLFVSPLPSISFQAQPQVAGCFHPSLSCRPLNENDLTELPVGIFDSLPLLNFLYVLAKKKGVPLFTRKCAVKYLYFIFGREKREGGEKVALAIVVCLIDIIL